GGGENIGDEFGPVRRQRSDAEMAQALANKGRHGSSLVNEGSHHPLRRSDGDGAQEGVETSFRVLAASLGDGAQDQGRNHPMIGAKRLAFRRRRIKPSQS